MVNALRMDPVLRREIPFHRAGIRRREYFRQRLLRNRRTVPYHLYIDRDEIPSEIIQAVNDRENTPHDLSFAPLPPELNPENSRQLQAIPAGEEPEEEQESPVLRPLDRLSNDSAGLTMQGRSKLSLSISFSGQPAESAIPWDAECLGSVRSFFSGIFRLTNK